MKQSLRHLWILTAAKHFWRPPFGRLLAQSVTLLLVSALTCHVSHTSPEAISKGAGASGGASGHLPFTEWWHEATDYPVVAVLVVIGAVAIYAHAQRFMGFGLKTLARIIDDAADANSEMAEGFDEVISAIRNWLSPTKPKVGSEKPSGPRSAKHEREPVQPRDVGRSNAA